MFHLREKPESLPFDRTDRLDLSMGNKGLLHEPEGFSRWNISPPAIHAFSYINKMGVPVTKLGKYLQ